MPSLTSVGIPHPEIQRAMELFPLASKTAIVRLALTRLIAELEAKQPQEPKAT